MSPANVLRAVRRVAADFGREAVEDWRAARVVEWVSARTRNSYRVRWSRSPS